MTFDPSRGTALAPKEAEEQRPPRRQEVECSAIVVLHALMPALQQRPRPMSALHLRCIWTMSPFLTSSQA